MLGSGGSAARGTAKRGAETGGRGCGRREQRGPRHWSDDPHVVCGSSWRLGCRRVMILPGCRVVTTEHRTATLRIGWDAERPSGVSRHTRYYRKTVVLSMAAAVTRR